MELGTRFDNLAVVGAAGKMGSGISLLLALEMAYRALEHKGGTLVLNLIDQDDAALQGLLQYLREQAQAEAERRIGRLRELFRDRADLVENGEMIQEYVREVLLHLRTGKTLALAAESSMVFEAVLEKEDLKASLFRELASLCPGSTSFFSNTSAIPIHGLAEAAGIRGRLIGFHFYNPPAVQKLVEVIAPEGCDPELKALAAGVAGLLGKTPVPAGDIAGFIGTGHFTRDALHGLGETQRLAREHGFPKAALMVETVSRDYLLRPMGIFQLIDYVGIDVFQLILKVMEKHLAEGLHSPLVDRFLELGVRGGQLPGGAQRDGFLKYEKGRPVAIFDPGARAYVSLSEPWAQEARAILGPHPCPGLTWKALQRDPERDDKLKAFFRTFQGNPALGVRLARAHLKASREIALGLVQRGVARRVQDVNDVLTLGFFHLYGPVHDDL